MSDHRNASRRGIASAIVALIAILASALPAAALEPMPPAAGTDGDAPVIEQNVGPMAPARGTIQGDCVGTDCLALTVNTDGTVGAVKDGTRVLPHGSASGGFSVRMVGTQPNILTNPGFESPTGGWTFQPGTIKPVRSTDQHHDGLYSAKIAIAGTTKRTSSVATQTVNISPNTSYVISAWSRTQLLRPTSTETTAPLTYKPGLAPAFVFVQVLDSANNVLRQDWLYSYTDSSGWSRQTLGVKTFPTATKIKLSIQVAKGYGTVWFDDLSVTRLFAPTASPLTGINTTFVDASGTINDRIQQTATVTGQPLQLDAEYKPTAKGIEITGSITDTASTDDPTTDRAFQVTYNVPINAVNWAWGDTPRSSRKISAAVSYFFDNGFNVPTARYPWETVFDGSTGLSMGSPLSTPRAHALRYNSTQGLTITFDLAASRAATTLGAKATFKIQLFRSVGTFKSGPVWGFRGAIAQYYAMNPSSFTRRTVAAREGIPFYSPPRDELDPPATPKDESKKLTLGLNVVGLGYDSSSGKPYSAWDEQNGRNIYTAAYTHHWGLFLLRCATGPQTCPLKTYAKVVMQLDAAAAKSCGSDPVCQRDRDEAIAAKASTSLDLNGRYRFDFAAGDYRLRQVPGLHLPTSIDWWDTVRTYQLEAAKALAAAPPTPATLDAIYIDSASGMRPVWGDTDDYDRVKWAALPDPASLTFSYNSGLTTLKSVFANYLDLRQTADWAHANGAVVVLDTNGKEQSPGGNLQTDLADWLLIENSLKDLEFPPAGVTPDSYGMLKRIIAGQRPVSTVDPKLANGQLPFSSTVSTADTVTSRVIQSLFYDIYPGPEKFDSGNITHWWRSSIYRKLYGKYGPLFRALSAAGWEPITNAVSSNPGIWVERYGKASDDDLNIALRNDGSTTQTAKITVYLNKDGLTSVEVGTNARERVQGATAAGVSQPITLNASRTIATFTISIPANRTRMVTFNRP